VVDLAKRLMAPPNVLGFGTNLCALQAAENPFNHADLRLLCPKLLSFLTEN
jgi:hypothetical protein